MVDLPNVAGFNDDADLHPVLLPDEVVMHSGEHEQRRDRRVVLVGVAVGEHDELGAVRNRLVHLLAHLRQALLHGLRALVNAVETLDGGGQLATGLRIDVLDLREFVIVDDREIENDLLCVLRGRRQQVALRAKPKLHRRDNLLADGVERRVGDLRELLGEVVEEQPRTLRENRNRRV